MAYRGDFLLGTILRFLPMVTTILLWQAIYAGLAARRSLAGFRYREMIAYLLLTHISRMFSSMPGLAGGIARDIREGTLKNYLIQPVDMIGYLLSYRVAHKVAYITMSSFPTRSCSSSAAASSTAFPTPLTLAAYAVSLVLAFLVGFFFEASVGMVGFWFLEVTSLLYIVMTLELLHLRAHAPAGPAAPALGGHPQGPAVPVHGLFPGRGLPGQDHGLGAGPAPAARAGLGRRLHAPVPRPVPAGAAARTAPMEGEPMLATVGKYLRLLGHLARYTLNRELAFRGNFLVKVSVEVLWLGILLAFYRRSSPRPATSPTGPRPSTSSSWAASSRSTA